MTTLNNKPGDKEGKAPWKGRFNDIMNLAQGELKKATKIGKQMIIAGQSNSSLNSLYAKLGELTYRSLKKDILDWENKEAERLVQDIDEIKNALEDLEDKIQNIKNPK